MGLKKKRDAVVREAVAYVKKWRTEPASAPLAAAVEALENQGGPAKVLYVIRHIRRPVYMTVEGFATSTSAGRNDPKDARVSWGSREAASEWVFDEHGNQQVILKTFDAAKGWCVAGGWCVGLDAAQTLIRLHGGILVPIVRRVRMRQVAA